MSIALVVGSMIGSGIFSIPTALAPYGGIGLLGWLVAAVWAIFLAKMMSYLAKHIPATGGPYAFSRAGFGDLVGFFVAWGYWLSIWTTNAAITITFVSYLSVFIPALSSSTLLSTMASLLTLWSLTLINSYSVRGGGKMQLVSTLLKIIPILVVVTGAIFFFNPDHFTPFNPSGSTNLQAISVTSTLCLFAFLGLEAATIPAGNVKNPKKTIPRATIIGTGLVIFIYIFSSLALFGLLPPEQVANSTAPYSDAAMYLWGDWAKYLVAAGACISAFGALNGWILIQGQMPLALAQDQLLPKAFAKTNQNEAPYFSIIASSVIITILLLANQTKGLTSLYSFMLQLTAVTVLFSYIFSAAAYGRFALRKQFNLNPSPKHLILALIGVLFSIWLLIGSGNEAILWGAVGMIAGLPIYLWKKNTPI